LVPGVSRHFGMAERGLQTGSEHHISSVLAKLSLNHDIAHEHDHRCGESCSDPDLPNPRQSGRRISFQLISVSLAPIPKGKTDARPIQIKNKPCIGKDPDGDAEEFIGPMSPRKRLNERAENATDSD